MRGRKSDAILSYRFPCEINTLHFKISLDIDFVPNALPTGGNSGYHPLMALNNAQREAVETMSGPLLVLAGAGTGKTRVVTYRISQLIRSGISPANILAVTFTNKAAREMQQRSSDVLGRRLKQKPEISTFHSLCFKVLKRQIHHLGYPPSFAIADASDQEALARAALREIRVSSDALRPRELLQRISRWKSSGVRPAKAIEVADSDKDHLAASGYRRYQKALFTAGKVDFDDLLVCTEELFRRFPHVQAEEAARYRHLLIDEYQDTNASQYRIVKSLAQDHRNLCVVGDDDQSIYGWRGAEVTHILRFRHDWPDAKVVRLEENYRSTSEILRLANRLIVFNKIRHEKALRAVRVGGETPRILQFRDENLEAEGVVGEIRHRLEEGIVEPRDVAILFRTNEQPRSFELTLRKQKLPYVLVGGMSFYDRKEVRDVLAYLKVLSDPRDEVSLLRILNTPARGIGQDSIRTMVNAAVGRGRPVWDLLPELQRIPGISAATAKNAGGFYTTITRLRDLLHTKRPLEVARELLRQIRYEHELARIYKDEQQRESRWQAVEQVINSLADYQRKVKRPNLSEFLAEFAITGRDEDQDKETKLSKNAVALMTLHSAKGLEFPEVYMVGMEEGLLPHRRAIEEDGPAIDEERRLCYVGLTRAQDRLTLTMALTRMKWGKPRDSHPSRFLYELTGQEGHPRARRARMAKHG